jgi:hypothetical protein
MHNWVGHYAFLMRGVQFRRKQQMGVSRWASEQLPSTLAAGDNHVNCCEQPFS